MYKEFNQDDRVVYVGSKFNELSSQIGFVVAPVKNQNHAYVVDFSGESYVVNEKSIRHYKPGIKDDGPQVIPIRRRRSDDDD